MSDDFLQRFQLERAGVRGALVRLDETWGRILAIGAYEGAAASLLARTLAASALFTSAIRFQGRLSIHIRDSGALRLLFAECTHDGELRGVARADDDARPDDVRLQTGARIAITIENALTDTRYQGLVPVEHAELAQAFEGYFERSEQLPTRIVLADDGARCGGLMLQQIASGGGLGSGDEDGWNRCGHLLATLGDGELLQLPGSEVLRRLFHEEDARVQAPQPLSFACQCSRGRVADMLRAVGREESESVLAEQGSVDVTCEFCSRRYVFDADDVAAVFAAPGGSATTPTRH